MCASVFTVYSLYPTEGVQLPSTDLRHEPVEEERQEPELAIEPDKVGVRQEVVEKEKPVKQTVMNPSTQTDNHVTNKYTLGSCILLYTIHATHYVKYLKCIHYQLEYIACLATLILYKFQTNSCYLLLATPPSPVPPHQGKYILEVCCRQ